MTEKKLSYGSYLQLDRILQSQVLKSSENGETVHDEMLFIIIHIPTNSGSNKFCMN